VGIRCGFEAVADLEIARFRLSQLASANPGEYFVFDLRTKQVPVSLVSTNEELHADSRIAFDQNLMLPLRFEWRRKNEQ
jgi:hypothetical protein